MESTTVALATGPVAVVSAPRACTLLPSAMLDDRKLSVLFTGDAATENLTGALCAGL